MSDLSLFAKSVITVSEMTDLCPPKPCECLFRTNLTCLSPLKGLGLTTTAQAVADALDKVFPVGHAGLNQADVIRKVFLHFQAKKK